MLGMSVKCLMWIISLNPQGNSLDCYLLLTDEDTEAQAG